MRKGFRGERIGERNSGRLRYDRETVKCQGSVRAGTAANAYYRIASNLAMTLS